MKGFIKMIRLLQPKIPVNLLRYFGLAVGIFFSIHAGAQITVEPSSHQFEPGQTGTISEEQLFRINYQGPGAMQISPSDIRIRAQQAQSTEVSVLTYNLWFDSQNWPARFAHMLSEIRELDPDIIGLQEVIQRPALENQAKMMADSLGYYYSFSSRSAETAETRFGNAILSRFPIAETNWRALNPLSDYRTAIHARIEVGGNTIDFYNTHLHNAAVNVHIREEQINDLLDFIGSTKGDGFVFLTGDFNANPDWPEMNLVYDHFLDVYPFFYADHLGPSHGTLNHHLGHQQRRIDFIFFGKEKKQYLAPQSASVVLNKPGNAGVWGSDHFGVFAGFQILSDADAFILNNIAEEIILESPGFTEVGLSFAPFTEGNKKAMLVVKDNEVPVEGFAFDATIMDFPWLEDFSGMDEQLPQGWHSNVANWKVSDTDLAGGGAPEVVFSSDPNNEGSFRLSSPRINTIGLDSMLLSFRHSVVTHNEPGNFVLKLVSKSGDEEHLLKAWDDQEAFTSETEMLVLNNIQHGIGANILHLAWIIEGDTCNIAGWHLDDIRLKAFPALSVSSVKHRFGFQQINTSSEPQKFMLSNIGGGTISLSPDDIRIEGTHAGSFTLQNLESSLLLQHADTASIRVVFHPVEVAVHEATLIAGSKEVSLLGEGFDPTITSLPWMEDFSGLAGGGLPLGWSGNAVNWDTFNAANAGGEAPEMVFWWQPETTGRFYVVTPEINAEETDSLVLSFKHRIRNFGSPGKYTLGFVAIANGKEYLIHEWVDPDFTPPALFTALIDAASHGIGQSPFQLAWVFDGRTDNITQWDIDDIMLEKLPESPMPEMSPAIADFGRQTVDTSSDPVDFVIRNIGGGILTLNPDSIRITGVDSHAFTLFNLDNIEQLKPFTETHISVSFSPSQPGEKHAELLIPGASATLKGIATDVIPYFVYSDFTIADNNRQYTNVEGFREVPSFARNGSLIASDIINEGEFGNVILQLAYDLSFANDFTVYYMWAYPFIDLSEFNEIVLYIKGSEPVSGVKLQLFDTDGVRRTNGGGYTYFDIGREWDKIVVPINELTKMDWARNLPDMSRIQRLDLVFEKDKIVPGKAIVFVDLVAFNQGTTSLPEMQHVSDFQIFPNPARHVVHVMTVPGSVITLFDLSGKTILEHISDGQLSTLGISQLNEGIYLMRIINENDDIMKYKKIFVY